MKKKSQKPILASHNNVENFLPPPPPGFTCMVNCSLSGHELIRSGVQIQLSDLMAVQPKAHTIWACAKVKGVIFKQFSLGYGIEIKKFYKLTAILRRQYGIISTASWKKIYSVLGGVAKRRSPIRNIFSFNAVNIMPYCHIKIAISFVSQFNCFQAKRKQN